MVKKSQKTSVNKTNKGRFDSFKAKQPEASGSSHSEEKPNPSLVTDKDIVDDTYIRQSILPSNVLDTQEFIPIKNDIIMKTDNSDFIVIARPSPFACVAPISKNTKNLPTPKLFT